MSARGVAHVRGSAEHAERYGVDETGPSPAEQMRATLAELRAAGLGFSAAWVQAWECITWPALKHQRDEWRMVLASPVVRASFAAAYDRREMAELARATARLEDCLVFES